MVLQRFGRAVRRGVQGGAVYASLRSRAETVARLVSAYEAEQPISALHGSPLALRPTYAQPSNALTVSVVADPTLDADAATQIAHTFGQPFDVGASVPKEFRKSDVLRGFNPNLMLRASSDKCFSAYSKAINYSTGGTETELSPGDNVGVWISNKTIDFTLNSDVFYLAIGNGAHGVLDVRVDGAIIAPTIQGPTIEAGNGPGQVLNPTGYPGDKFLKCKFASVGTRRVLVNVSGSQVTGRIFVRDTAAIAFNAPALRWLAFGDSFGEGVVSDSGPKADINGFPQMMYHAMHGAFGFGFDQINMSIGGSGFYTGLRPGGAVALNTPLSFRRSLQMNSAGLNADLITVLGPINDVGYVNNATFASEVSQFIDDARSMHPNAVIAFFGSNASPSSVASGLSVQLENKLATICATKGVIHVPMQTATPPWLSGTGKQGSPAGDGNADYMTGSDGTHPTVLGHRLTGEFMARELYKRMFTEKMRR